MEVAYNKITARRDLSVLTQVNNVYTRISTSATGHLKQRSQVSPSSTGDEESICQVSSRGKCPHSHIEMGATTLMVLLCGRSF